MPKVCKKDCTELIRTVWSWLPKRLHVCPHILEPRSFFNSGFWPTWDIYIHKNYEWVTARVLLKSLPDQGSHITTLDAIWIRCARFVKTTCTVSAFCLKCQGCICLFVESQKVVMFLVRVVNKLNFQSPSC